MSTFFISDAHLGLGDSRQEKRKEDRLLSFLRFIRPAAKGLFILGDLFDFWFEYATVIPKGYHRTLAALQEFTDGGIPVHYLEGNHDFWIRDFFSKELGMTVYRDPFEIAVDGKRLYLHHGDGLAQKDLGYRIIKPILRNSMSIWLYRWLHPDIGVRIAKGLSRKSRAYTGQKDFGEEDGMLRFATSKIESGIDIVMMGHRHKPVKVDIGRGVYVNLGDWISANSYGVMNQGVMKLETWKG